MKKVFVYQKRFSIFFYLFPIITIIIIIIIIIFLLTKITKFYADKGSMIYSVKSFL